MIVQYLGQQMMVGISGLSLTSEEKKFIVDNNIGGVILFGRNVQEPKQVYELCKEISSLSQQQVDKAPLLIGIDMEGGRVHRLKAPFTKWPALANLGRHDNTTMSFDFAHAMGMELKAVGINFDFAPCVDIFTNPKNTVIGDRAIGNSPDLVERHASALVRGYIKANVLTCAKHFPGHGHTLVDSHEDLPVEPNMTMEELSARELIPFRKAFRSRVDFVMTAHIRFTKIDDEPVTFSKYFIRDFIKNECRYRGLVITDDLDMGAMIKNYSREEIPVKALNAGVDMLLYCNDPSSPVIAIDGVSEAIANAKLDKRILQDNHERILRMKSERPEIFQMESWDQVSSIIGCPEHQELAAKILQA